MIDEKKDIRTPELNEDVTFRLTYKEVYLRLRKLVERWPESEEKQKHLQELGEDYQKVAEKLNL